MALHKPVLVQRNKSKRSETEVKHCLRTLNYLENPTSNFFMKLAFVNINDLTIHFRRVETRTENEDPNLRVRNSKHTQSM